MSVWSLLGIESTKDKRQIKRAYAKRLKEIDAAKDPQAFQLLREAFDQALTMADYEDHSWQVEMNISPDKKEVNSEDTVSSTNDNSIQNWHVLNEGENKDTRQEVVDHHDVEFYLNSIGQALQLDDQRQAMNCLDSAINEIYAIDSRFDLEENLLRLIHYFDYRHLEFIFYAVKKLSWKMNLCPFRDFDHIRIYNYIQLLLERYEFIQSLKEKYAKYRDDNWIRAEEVLFAEHDKQELESIYVNSAQERAMKTIIEYIDIRNPHPEINPVSRATREWWEKRRKKATQEQLGKTARKESGLSHWWLIWIVLFIVVKVGYWLNASNSPVYHRTGSQIVDSQREMELKEIIRRAKEMKRLADERKRHAEEARLHNKVKKNPVKEKPLPEEKLGSGSANIDDVDINFKDFAVDKILKK